MAAWPGPALIKTEEWFIFKTPAQMCFSSLSPSQMSFLGLREVVFFYPLVVTVIHQFKIVRGLWDARPDFPSDQHIQGILLSFLFLPRQLKL